MIFELKQSFISDLIKTVSDLLVSCEFFFFFVHGFVFFSEDSVYQGDKWKNIRKAKSF